MTYFDLPGIKTETERFKVLLMASSPQDHILIRGPRGVGKSLFKSIALEQLGLPEKKMARINCGAFPSELVSSELFGAKKGAYTGATKDTIGYIKMAENQGNILILDELNSLSLDGQTKLLIYLEDFVFYRVGGRDEEKSNVRIIATMNDEADTQIRNDLFDRFKIAIDIPPLYKRRSDVFFHAAKRYPELDFLPSEILHLLSYHWPGNHRELDRYLFEIRATAELRSEFKLNGFWQKIGETLIDAGLSIERWGQINLELFGGIIPFTGFDQWGIDKNFRCNVFLDQESNAPMVRVINQRENSTTSIDVSNLMLFSKAVFGESSPTKKKPIFENDIFIEKTEFWDIRDLPMHPSVAEGSANSIHQAAFSWDNTRKDMVFEFNSACKKAQQLSLASELKIECLNKKLSVEQVAEYLIKEGNFPSVFESCVHKIGVGAQTELAKILSVPKSTINRWFKKWGGIETIN